MRPVVIDVTRSVICVSVCLYAGHTDVLCKNGWTHRDAVWRGWPCEPKEPCIYMAVEIPTEKDNFGGDAAHWKALGDLAAVYAAKR